MHLSAINIGCLPGQDCQPRGKCGKLCAECDNLACARNPNNLGMVEYNPNILRATLIVIGLLGLTVALTEFYPDPYE